MIIGGTGSLGSAILKQQELLKANGIKRIRVLSRDEIKQDRLEKEYRGEIQLQCFLADVRSEDRIRFGIRGADYVIHAAALKMIDRFERDIPEGYQTNILGTMNVQKAILATPKIKKALLVSTDKAADPLNAYGVSKLAAEKVWLWANTFQKEQRFQVARYGNVFGSRGSVIEHWEKCIQESVDLTITDSEMTRFFILLSDASHFVLNSLFNGLASICIPKMKAIRMLELAIFWNRIHGRSIERIQEIGIREGEKIHEALVSIHSGNPLTSDQADEFTFEEVKAMHDERFSECASCS